MKLLTLLLVLLLPSICLRAAAPPPVTPEASPEARALLELVQQLGGRHFLTGQHNYPAIRDRNSQFATYFTGRVPAIWSSDLGHAKAGDYDSYLARPEIVAEAIRQHQAGKLITLCWHAVPPTADEPVTFSKQPGADPKRLTSVQGQLLDEQFRDVLTPGTALHTQWQRQVDAIAVTLRQLEVAKVPVLWRPYHEMNGDWFWWGGRQGEYSTRRLYVQLFERLVHFHHLKNLVWVWNVDRVTKPAMEHAPYFPGLEFVDVLSLDVYRNDFAQKYYDSLVALAGDKPLALTEVGNPPALEVLNQQPRWAFYVVWAGMTHHTPRSTYQTLFADPRVVNWGDPSYVQATSAYREALGLPALSPTLPAPTVHGLWKVDDTRTQLTGWGAANFPSRLEVQAFGPALSVRSVRILEHTTDEATEEKFPKDGSPVQTAYQGGIRTTRLKEADGQQHFDVTVQMPTDANGPSTTGKEVWTLSPDGRTLKVERRFQTPRGLVEATGYYERL